MTSANPEPHWDEDTSKNFLDYGRYFIPEREQQMRMVLSLLRHQHGPLSILELCCGEGLLAEILLDGISNASYVGLDGSPLMLEKASSRLSRFGSRTRLDRFELADRGWRNIKQPFQAIVSFLAIHHLEAAEKRVLYQDIFACLDSGGALVIGDMVEPASSPGREIAAETWDEAVRKRSLELDGTLAGFEFFQREGWNTYRFQDPDDIDHPSPLFDQLKWLDEADFVGIEVHFMQAGHALFSAWKQDDNY